VFVLLRFDCDWLGWMNDGGTLASCFCRGGAGCVFELLLADTV
jgi:hypothetical protein